MATALRARVIVASSARPVAAKKAAPVAKVRVRLFVFARRVTRRARPSPPPPTCPLSPRPLSCARAVCARSVPAHEIAAPRARSQSRARSRHPTQPKRSPAPPPSLPSFPRPQLAAKLSMTASTVSTLVATHPAFALVSVRRAREKGIEGLVAGGVGPPVLPLAARLRVRCAALRL